MISKPKDLVFHPSVTVKDLLEDRSIPLDKFLNEINYDKSYVLLFLKSKENINPEFAKVLEDYFGVNKRFWINPQRLYDSEMS